jgi:hypothetical protein
VPGGRNQVADNSVLVGYFGVKFRRDNEGRNVLEIRECVPVSPASSSCVLVSQVVFPTNAKLHSSGMSSNTCCRYEANTKTQKQGRFVASNEMKKKLLHSDLMF